MVWVRLVQPLPGTSLGPRTQEGAVVKKIDLKKELKHLYAPSARKAEVVEVPDLRFVMVDGYMEPRETPPASAAFQNAIAALYGLSFALKFMSKQRKTNPIDYGVTALECLWWVDAGGFDFQAKDRWRWTLMMMQPKHITESMFRTALRKLREEKDSPTLAKIRFDTFREGVAIQIMHVGPYAEEPGTMALLKAFAQENGYRYRGKHHEIYLGDPRRAKPEKLRTILRQPVEKAPAPAKAPVRARRR
jgi:hypothetical protein